MSSGSEVFPFNSGASAEPTFEKALNGYDKKQVNRYVQQVEAEIAALAAEREETYAQINLLNQHVTGLQAELDAARRFVATGDSVSYRHLGPRVEQILALAEEQADDIRIRVERDLSDREQELSRVRAELDVKAFDASRNFEAALADRRAEEERATAQRRSELMTEVESAKAYADKIRADVDVLYAAAQEESTRVGAATKEYAEKVRLETESHAALVRAQVEQELSDRQKTTLSELDSRATAHEQTLTERLATAEAQLAEARAKLDEEINVRRVAAELELAQRRAAVEREAADAESRANDDVRGLRSDAEQYAATLRAKADEQFADAQRQAGRLLVDAQNEAEARLTRAEGEADRILATAEALLAEARTSAQPNPTGADRAAVIEPAAGEPVVDAAPDATVEAAVVEPAREPVAEPVVEPAAESGPEHPSADASPFAPAGGPDQPRLAGESRDGEAPAESDRQPEPDGEYRPQQLSEAPDEAATRIPGQPSDASRMPSPAAGEPADQHRDGQPDDRGDEHDSARDGDRVVLGAPSGD